MKKYLTAYAAALLCLLVADGLWLGVLMPDQYREWIGPLMLAQPRLGPAAAFYLLYPVGLLVFAIAPALSGKWADCAWRAALFGLVAYGTYDLSNLATLKGWPLELTVVDMVWGSCLSVAVATAGWAAARALARRTA